MKFVVERFAGEDGEFDLKECWADGSKSIRLGGTKQELLSAAKAITKFFNKKPKASKKEKK